MTDQKTDAEAQPEQPELEPNWPQPVDADVEEVGESDGETDAQPGEAEEAEPAESSTEEPTDAKGTDKYQDRIDELTRRRYEAERERDYYRQQLEGQKAPEKPPEVDLSEVKTFEDFDYDERKYAEYMWGEAQRRGVEAARQELAKETEQRTAAQRFATFGDREAAYSKAHEDYYQVTRDQTLPMSQAMVEVAADMENGPAVLHYLGKHRDVAERIARLPTVPAAAEMARIDERMNQARQQSGPKVSSAPKPPAKVAASGSPQTVSPSSAASDKLSGDEWLKRRQKEISKRAS